METKNSIYCYPGTNILINKLDIHDSNKLLSGKTTCFLQNLIFYGKTIKFKNLIKNIF